MSSRVVAKAARDTSATTRAAALLHASLAAGAPNREQIASAACKLPLRSFASLDAEDADSLALMCGERSASTWVVVCLVLALVAAAWVFIATDTANRQVELGEAPTWVPPPWIIVLPLLASAYMAWYLPKNALTSMTAEQIELALSGQDMPEWLTQRAYREGAAQTTAASGIFAATNLASSVAPY